MNKPLRRVAAGCLLLLFALLINVTYVQGFQADELNERSDNRRVLLDEYSKERGPILVGETELARSVPSDGEFAYQREYTDPTVYAPLTGYYSSVFGRSALERAQNSVLSGDDDRFFVRRLVDLVSGEEQRGGAIELTINDEAQQAAYDALGDNKGAAIAIDPSTGGILAMVSKPSYDPNPLASHSVETQQEAWDELNSDEDKPALNRAIAQTLPPGSVFKLVTAAAALEEGDYTPDSTIPGPASYDLPLTDSELPNYDGQACGPGGQTTLTNALDISCNTAFAYLGNDLGGDALREQAQRFGFGSQPLANEDLNAAASQFPADPDEPQEALSAIGQYDVTVTPLQMAMVTAAIANDGTLMTPYVVDEILAPNLVRTFDETEPSEQSEAMSESAAQDLQEMMVSVVENGTGSNAAIEDVEVGGKTGTAQSSPDRPPYAWFTSFAPADDPQVAVAVVIEEATDVPRTEIGGNALAAPVAHDVMEAVLE
ncbi:MAG TPA: penicillin-binding protein 2 [Jiangellaceae bacterium]|nr:penicillin-binding protein 2 [Jiangellaceae bacterium]